MMRKKHLTSGIFYYWNDDLTPARIKADISAMARAGFQYVFLHPMPEKFRKECYFCGMKAAYLGRRFMTLTRVMVDECRKNGLAMMLYDEGGWPSGSVLGSLVKKHPECRVVSYVKNAAGKIGKQTEEIPDLLRRETTRRFIELTHERYFRALGDEFGKTIRGIFTDEPFWTAQSGWEMVRCNGEISRLFKRKYGLDFERDVLPLIFEGGAALPGAITARRRYLEICSQLFALNYSGELARWCRRHRIGLIGHLDAEDTYFISGNRCGELIQRLDAFHTPGIDVVFRQHYPGCDKSHIARFAAAAAIRNRRRETVAECFNVYGYGLTPSVMNWVACSLMVRGINQIAAMPYLASDRGKHKICCGTDISPRTPLWDAMPALTRFWNWCGNFDAGALRPKVWLLIRLSHADVDRGESDADHRAFEEKALETVRMLESRQVFFRFADAADLDGKELPELLILLENDAELAGKLRSLPCRVALGIPDDIDRYAEIGEAASSGCVTLPCRRTEGDALMITSLSMAYI